MSVRSELRFLCAAWQAAKGHSNAEAWRVYRRLRRRSNLVSMKLKAEKILEGEQKKLQYSHFNR